MIRNFRTIGIGTRIFLGGAQGFVVWPGTQFHTTKPKNEFGIPVTNARNNCGYWKFKRDVVGIFAGCIL